MLALSKGQIQLQFMSAVIYRVFPTTLDVHWFNFTSMKQKVELFFSQFNIHMHRNIYIFLPVKILKKLSSTQSSMVNTCIF